VENPRRSSSRSASPETKLPNVTGELDIIINGRSGSAYDSRSLDLNVSYEDFLDRLDRVVSTKLKKDDVHLYRQPLRYLWITTRQARGNPKNLPKPNAIEDEENYAALISVIRETATIKRELENQVLRIFYDLRLVDDVSGETVPRHVEQRTGRLVNFH
jgi:hypothetical protein